MTVALKATTSLSTFKNCFYLNNKMKDMLKSLIVIVVKTRPDMNRTPGEGGPSEPGQPELGTNLIVVITSDGAHVSVLLHYFKCWSNTIKASIKCATENRSCQLFFCVNRDV